MALKTYRYKQRGLTSDFIADQCGGTPPNAVGLLIPTSTQDVEYEESYHVDVLSAAQQAGYELVEESPPGNTAVYLAQVKNATLAADSSSIPVASGWTDVSGLSVNLSTFGGTIFGVTLSAVNAAIAVGAQVRVLINGGAFSDLVLGTAAFPLLTSSFAGFTMATPVSVTGSRTTYTVRVQARGLGVLASVSLAAGASSITVFEYAQ